MSSPILNHGVIAVDSVTDTFHEAQARQKAERGADAAITARAIVGVSLLGAGFWYMLWKLALLVVAGH
jgi:hypothetical protein